MSNFAKKLASIRKTRLNKVADFSVDSVDSFIQALKNAGYELADAEQALKTQRWKKIGPYDIMSGPMGNEILSMGSGKEVAEWFKQKVQEMNAALDQFAGTFYNRLSEDEVNDMVKTLSKKRKSMDCYYVIMNFGQAGAGNKTVQTNPGQYYAGLEDEELEKMAQALINEFGMKVRAMLASLKK